MQPGDGYSSWMLVTVCVMDLGYVSLTVTGMLKISRHVIVWEMVDVKIGGSPRTTTRRTIRGFRVSS